MQRDAKDFKTFFNQREEVISQPQNLRSQEQLQTLHQNKKLLDSNKSNGDQIKIRVPSQNEIQEQKGASEAKIGLSQCSSKLNNQEKLPQQQQKKYKVKINVGKGAIPIDFFTQPNERELTSARAATAASKDLLIMRSQNFQAISNKEIPDPSQTIFEQILYNKNSEERRVMTSDPQFGNKDEKSQGRLKRGIIHQTQNNSKGGGSILKNQWTPLYHNNWKQNDQTEKAVEIAVDCQRDMYPEVFEVKETPKFSECPNLTDEFTGNNNNQNNKPFLEQTTDKQVLIYENPNNFSLCQQMPHLSTEQSEGHMSFCAESFESQEKKQRKIFFQNDKYCLTEQNILQEIQQIKYIDANFPTTSNQKLKKSTQVKLFQDQISHLINNGQKEIPEKKSETQKVNDSSAIIEGKIYEDINKNRNSKDKQLSSNEQQLIINTNECVEIKHNNKSKEQITIPSKLEEQKIPKQEVKAENSIDISVNGGNNLHMESYKQQSQGSCEDYKKQSLKQGRKPTTQNGNSIEETNKQTNQEQTKESPKISNKQPTKIQLKRCASVEIEFNLNEQEEDNQNARSEKNQNKADSKSERENSLNKIDIFGLSSLEVLSPSKYSFQKENRDSPSLKDPNNNSALSSYLKPKSDDQKSETNQKYLGRKYANPKVADKHMSAHSFGNLPQAAQESILMKQVFKQQSLWKKSSQKKQTNSQHSKTNNSRKEESSSSKNQVNQKNKTLLSYHQQRSSSIGEISQRDIDKVSQKPQHQKCGSMVDIGTSNLSSKIIMTQRQAQFVSENKRFSNIITSPSASNNMLRTDIEIPTSNQKSQTDFVEYQDSFFNQLTKVKSESEEKISQNLYQNTSYYKKNVQLQNNGRISTQQSNQNNNSIGEQNKLNNESSNSQSSLKKGKWLSDNPPTFYRLGSCLISPEKEKGTTEQKSQREDETSLFLKIKPNSQASKRTYIGDPSWAALNNSEEQMNGNIYFQARLAKNDPSSTGYCNISKNSQSTREGLPKILSKPIRNRFNQGQCERSSQSSTSQIIQNSLMQNSILNLEHSNTNLLNSIQHRSTKILENSPERASSKDLGKKILSPTQFIPKPLQTVLSKLIFPERERATASHLAGCLQYKSPKQNYLNPERQYLN